MAYIDQLVPGQNHIRRLNPDDIGRKALIRKKGLKALHSLIKLSCQSIAS